MSQELPAETTSQETQPKPVKSRSGIRVILFLLLAMAVASLIVDRLQRQNAQADFDKIEAMMKEYDEAFQKDFGAKRKTADDVKAEIGREPDVAIDEGVAPLVEEYHYWGGLGPIRPIVVYVVYQTGEKPLLHDVSLNEDPRAE